MDATTMLLIPRLSEKAYGLSQARNTYVFMVPKAADKVSVQRAVAAQFGVTVENVNILRVKGKSVRTTLKRSRPIAGKRGDMKKALVTITAGEIIPIFAAEDEAAEKAEKAAAKVAKRGRK